MSTATDCPQAAELASFLRGDLPEPDMERIAHHLEGCHTCWRSTEAEPEAAAFADDLKWAADATEQTVVDINVPLERLNSLLPDYDILCEIGRGGMGIVFEARHLKLDRRVALKVLPALLGVVRPDAIPRFRREAALAARLKHTNIIGVYDFDDVDGTLYYAMELIEGRSLRGILAEIDETGAIDVVLGADAGESLSQTSKAESRKPTCETSKGEDAVGDQPSAESQKAKAESRKAKGERLPRSDFRLPTSPVTRIGSSARTDRGYYRQVCRWIAEVADALHYAHGEGVIHRDVKPSNLLLAANNRLMISDFGLARAAGADTLTASHALLGTARYMSPEQIDERAAPVDARTDVYALGATLYELLAFRPMFAAADDREVLNCVLNREPPPPHRFVRQVPRELETICLKAVEKDRNNRYASAEALADDLRRWLLDLPIHARRPSIPVRAAKFVRRRKLPSALAAAVVILLGVSGIIYAAYGTSAREATDARADARSRGLQVMIHEAQTELQEGDFVAAMGRVEAGLAQEPDSLELHRMRASVLHHMGRDEEALAAYGEILASHPDDWATHYQLALALTDRSRQGMAVYASPDSPVRNMSREEWEQRCAFHREQVERLKPDSAEAFCLRARQQTDPHQAIELLDQALERCPTLGEALLARSMRFEQVGDYEAMLMDAERAISMRYGWAITHIQRGLALYSLGRFEEAEQSFGEAIERDPNGAAAWHNRGLAKSKLGRFAEALADATEALRLDGNWAWAYVGRARSLAGLGRFDDALADLDRAIELQPTGIEIYLDRANLYFQAGRLEDAIADSTHVIQLAPDDPRGHKSRAVEHMQAKQYERAIADLTQCLRLEPDNASLYRTLGHAHIRTKDYTEAIADYAKAMELEPGLWADYHNRANLCLHLGQFKDAVADLTYLIELDSAPDLALLRRGMAYEFLGATRLALADYGTVSEQNGPNGGYASLWRHILLRQTGEHQAAAEILSSHLCDKTGAAWPDRLFEFLAGEVAADTLLSDATTKNERCEAYYYIGASALLDGRTDAAKEAFAACLALKKLGLLETDFARARLKQLEGHHADAAHVPAAEVAATAEVSLNATLNRR